jgi:hypothetical protein
VPKYERFAESAKVLMIQAGFIPIGAYKGAQKPWLVECKKCGTQFTTTYFKVKVGDLKNCPSCRSVLDRLFAVEAEKLMQDSGLTVLEPYPGSNSKPWRCRCNTCQRLVQPAYATVRAGGSGCKFCGLKKAAESKRVPQLVARQTMLLANLEPLADYESAREPWKCKCLKCGSIVFPNYNAIQQGEGGCASCGRDSARSKRRTEEGLAKSVMQSKGYEPLEPYVNKQVGWKCRCLNCGQVVHPSFSNVQLRQKNYGCIYCSGGRVTEAAAIKVMESAGVLPIEPYPGKDIPWLSKCVKCLREVNPTYANARRGQGGCKFCAEHGIDLVGPAYLYVMTHQNFNAYKVGIGKSGGSKANDRINNLTRTGWELIKKFKFETGLEAQTLESKFFQIVRSDLNIPVFLSAEDMKSTAGHTETMDSDRISIQQILEILRLISTMETS